MHCLISCQAYGGKDDSHGCGERTVWRGVRDLCACFVCLSVFKTSLEISEKCLNLKNNHKLLLEIWSLAFLATFIYLSIQKCKNLSLRATEGDLWLQPFFQVVLGKKNEAVFDQATAHAPHEAVENAGNMPPLVGKNTDHAQTISSMEYKTSNYSIQGLECRGHSEEIWQWTHFLIIQKESWRCNF